MNRMLTAVLLSCLAIACSPPDTSFYEISTPKGRMVVRLYDETPQHRDNFRRLADEGFYDGTLFHRVIARFMIQGGDPNSKDQDPMNDGQGGPGYRIPAEFVPGLFHKRGALAAARDNNPERASSGSQFYIVHGAVLADSLLSGLEERISRETGTEFRFSPEAREAYTTVGGAPWLDGQYTVFGELVEGFEVLDSIAATPTPNDLGHPAPPGIGERPVEDITMTVRPLPDYGRN
jgi:peptidyl-prolyl cis-trans isomerase B (cyclophilin B)